MEQQPQAVRGDRADLEEACARRSRRPARGRAALEQRLPVRQRRQRGQRAERAEQERVLRERHAPATASRRGASPPSGRSGASAACSACGPSRRASRPSRRSSAGAAPRCRRPAGGRCRSRGGSSRCPGRASGSRATPRPIGWIAEQTSCLNPGSVSSFVRVPPPIVRAASSTSTLWPLRAISTAAARPLGPEPTTTASYSGATFAARTQRRCGGCSRSTSTGGACRRVGAPSRRRRRSRSTWRATSSVCFQWLSSRRWPPKSFIPSSDERVLTRGSAPGSARPSRPRCAVR